MVHKASVLTAKGDEPVIKWNPTDAAQVAVARKVYDEYKSKGFAAFRMSRGNEKGQQMKEFDASAERILFVPAIQGG